MTSRPATASLSVTQLKEVARNLAAFPPADADRQLAIHADMGHFTPADIDRIRTAVALRREVRWI